MNMSNYFDLKEIWINELFGDVWIFLFVGLIAIWIISAKAKIPFQVATLFSIFWIGLCVSVGYSSYGILWGFAVLFAGFMFYYGVAKLLK